MGLLTAQRLLYSPDRSLIRVDPERHLDVCVGALMNFTGFLHANSIWLTEGEV